MAEISILYDPPEPSNGPDVIFVHGLGGHFKSTWMSNVGKGETCWPVWVGEDAKVRVWSVGYDADLSKWTASAMPLPDQADSLLDLLTGEPRLRDRRLVFIGHSLGGLVIKTALTHAKSLGVERYRALLPRVAGIVFLATPHSGAQLANIARAVSFALKTNDQVADLTIHNAHLRTLNGVFLGLLGESKIPVRTFAETRGVPIGPRLRWFPWLLRPLTKVVVDPTSSEPNVPGERAVPLPEDHLSICKPTKRSTQIHNSLLDFLRGIDLAASAVQTTAASVGCASAGIAAAHDVSASAATDTRPSLTLDADGRFTRGKAGVRRAALTLLEGSWDGQITVHAAAVDALEVELRALAALPGLSEDQGERLELLRGYKAVSQTSLAGAKTALAMTFGPTGARERCFGIRMNLENTTKFIQGLFAHAGLAAREAVPLANCWLYVPWSDHKIHVAVKLPDDVIHSQQRWVNELAQFKERLWRNRGWNEMLPISCFSNDEVASFLLPAMAYTLAKTVPMVEGSSLAQHWVRLTEVLPKKGDRDPLFPFDWCLALNFNRPGNDLAWWASPPPKWPSEIGLALGVYT